MALFRRKTDDAPPEQDRPGPDRPDPHLPDPDLPALSSRQASELRSMVQRRLAESGVEATVHGDHLRAAGGAELGLHNLAALCRDAPARGWRQLVDRHVWALVAATGPDPLATMSLEQLQAAVHLRLYDPAGIPNPDWFGYAREVVPGTLELLAVDLPETVATLNDAQLARFGGPDALRPFALANLRATGDLAVEVLQTDDGARLDVVVGESLFTASLALVLPDVLRTVLRVDDAPDGVLVAAPFRNQLALHVLRDAGALPSLQALVGFALDGYQDGPGPVSPWLHWWHEGAFTQLSGPGAEAGEVVVTVPEALTEVLNRLVG